MNELVSYSEVFDRSFMSFSIKHGNYEAFPVSMAINFLTASPVILPRR